MVEMVFRGKTTRGGEMIVRKKRLWVKIEMNQSGVGGWGTREETSLGRNVLLLSHIDTV